MYFLNKIKIFSIKLNNKKIRKIYSNKKLEQIDFNKIKQNIPINMETLKIIKNLNLKIKSLNLKMNIGIEDAIYTSYLVAAIASILSILLPHLVKKQDIQNIKYEITPIYNTLTFSLKLNSTINIKVINIIIVIYNLFNVGVAAHGDPRSKSTFIPKNVYVAKNWYIINVIYWKEKK